MSATATDQNGTYSSNTLPVTVLPAPLGPTISGNPTVNEDAIYTLNLATTNPDQLPINSWTINWGDGSPAQTVSGNPSSVTHVFADAGPYTINASVTDSQGSYAASPLNVSVQVVAPTVTISGPSTVNEEATYTLGLSATGEPSNHPITTWTINWGDGSQPQTIAGNPRTATYVYTDAGTYTISASASEDEGTFAAAPLTVTALVVPPTVTISGPASVGEDTTYPLTLSATGEPSNHPITSWTINWGDGSTPQTISGNPSSASYEYANAGTYTITASATEDEGTFAAAPLTIAVVVQPPTVTISGDPTVNEDATYTLNLSATGEPDNHPITSWTINWGDGSQPQTISGNPDTATYVYANAGTYTITASASEDEGTFPAAPLTVTAEVVPPTVTISGPSTVNEDATYTLDLSATGEPSNHPITSWTINWGDGSAPQTISGNPSTATYVYADAGNYTINASATEDEGTFAAAPLTVTAEVVPPTVTISGPSTVNEDATYTLGLSATGEPSNHPITSWTINWGDGSQPQTISGNPSTATYVYANAGPYTITASATEDEGTFSAAPLNVTALVVPPTVSISGSLTVNEDATYTLGLSATGEPSNHPITSWTINWGDGSQPQTISGNPSTATYVYADAGTYTITASATEDEGTFAAAPLTLTALVVPPTVTISGPSTVNEDATYTLGLSATGEPSNHPITSWTINWGDGSAPQTLFGNLSTATYVYANAGTYTITASATEDEGTFAASPLTVTAEVVPPTVIISGPSTVDEDATYTLDLSATGEPSNHPITSWTINWGDGSAPQTISGNPSTATYVYANAGTYTITASATEDEGTFAASPLTVTAEVVPPTVTISGPSTVNEDVTYSLALSATGEPSNHPITSWTINWGDGSQPQTISGNPSSATYVYADAGNYTITASATEDEGTFDASPLDVTVSVVAPTVTISGASTVNENATYTLCLSATGAPENHPITSWRINWGDGSAPQTISGNPSTATYVYADAGNYTITASASNDQGSYAAAPLTVTALVVPPTVTISGPSTVNEEATYTLDLSATGEPSNHPITSWTINWGDGSAPQTISGNPSTATYVYADAGTYTITASATEDEGTFAASPLTVTAEVVPPTVTISGPSTVNEDATYTLGLSATGEPSNHPITSWTINWGDGSQPQTISGNPSTATYVYANAGTYTITASATEDEGTFAAAPLTVTAEVVAPTVTISGSAAVGEETTYPLSLSATGVPSNHPITSWTINWGDGSQPQTISGNPSSATYVYADAGSYTITASASNNEGTFSAAPLTVTVVVQPPTVTISGPATVNEDATYTLNLSATGEPTNHPITSWTINWGDGSQPQTISGNPNTATYVYANAGNYTITASATEDEGTFSAAPLAVTALVVPPTVTISGPSTVNEDATYTLNLSATGEPSNHPITGWTINWGDGSAPQILTGNPSSVTHVFANLGTYTITGAATENEGTFAAAPLDVTVELVSPTVSISGPPTVNEDATYTLGLSSSSALANYPVTGWTINWGDGSAPQAISGNPSSATHIYANAGTYTITASAIDAQGTFAAAPLAVTAEVVPPTVTISGPATVYEEATYALHLSATGEPSNHPITSWTINWGDGSQPQTISGNPSSVTHVYANAGSYTINASATENEGTFAAAPFSVTALIVPPTVRISGPATVNEDATYTLDLSATGEPSNHPITGWTIYWGDGSAPQTVSGNPSSVTHVYANAGSYTINASATENEGTFGAAPLSVTARVVPPTVRISGPATVNEDATYTLDLSATGEPSNHPITSWTINWGDGSAAQTLTGNPTTVTHVYTNAGPYTITASATENEGTFAASPLNVTALVVPPTVTISGPSTVNEDTIYTLGLSATGEPSNHPITGWTINWGDGSAPETITGNPSSETHVYANAGSYTITASATDNEGTFSAAPLTVRAVVVPPTVTISGPSTVDEGVTYTLDLSATGEPANKPITGWTINWGDGSAPETITGDPASVTHTYMHACEVYVISGDAIDADGTFASNTLSVSVSDIPPDLTIGCGGGFYEGSPCTLNLSSECHGDDQVSCWIINWGDGTCQTIEGNPSSIQHTYSGGQGNCVITATAEDAYGSWTANTCQVPVNYVAPTLNLSGALTCSEGSPYTLNLAASDPCSDDQISCWTINWGDGIVQTIDGNPSLVTHTYACGATQCTISATATEPHATCQSNTIPVNIQEVVPSVTPAGSQTVEAGSTLSVTAGTFSEPTFPNQQTGTQQSFVGSINWGDGSLPVSGVVTIIPGSPGIPTTGRVWASHLYSTAGTDTATVTFTDGNGGVGKASFTVTVTPAPGDLGCYPTTTTITGIVDDTNGSTSDSATTTAQNIVIEGTAAPNTLVTISRSDIGVVGTTTSDANGNWALNYTGTTLANGTYDFTASAAPLGSLGVAGQFNAFVFGNFTETSDSQGRLAIGGNATLTGYGVDQADPTGQNVSDSSGARDDLIVGGRLTVNNGGEVYEGNVVYGTTASLGTMSYPNGTPRQDSVINFSAVQQYLTTASSNWRRKRPTAR